jgi:hypothetical protein
MKGGGKQKIRLQIIIVCFLLSCIGIVITTPIHEAAHWIMSEIDPYSEPIEFHLFDDKSFQNGENILSSALGLVTIKETYPGSFNDRPKWIDPFQELICLLTQLLITYFIVTKIIKIWMNKKYIMTRPI